jgi:hypothetical protein
MILDFTKLHNVLERIATALEGGAKPAAAEPAKRSPGRPAKGEGAPNPEQLAAAPAASTAAATVTGTTSAPADKLPPVVKDVTLAQVADAIIDLANNHSRDAAVKILSDAGVKRVPELKPEQYADVLAAVAKAKAPISASSGLV